MTRSVTIVNTSNWRYEDIDVEYEAGDVVTVDTLKPGEMRKYYADQKIRRIDHVDGRKKPEVFRDQYGDQVTPEVDVFFRTNDGRRSDPDGLEDDD